MSCQTLFTLLEQLGVRQYFIRGKLSEHCRNARPLLACDTLHRRFHFRSYSEYNALGLPADKHMFAKVVFVYQNGPVSNRVQKTVHNTLPSIYGQRDSRPSCGSNNQILMHMYSLACPTKWTCEDESAIKYCTSTYLVGLEGGVLESESRGTAFRAKEPRADLSHWLPQDQPDRYSPRNEGEWRHVPLCSRASR